MSATLQSPVRQAAGGAGHDPAPRRGRWIAIGVALILAAAGLAVFAVLDPFAAASSTSGATNENGAPTALATVRQGPLSSQVNQSGTLSYAAQADGSPYQIVNQASGTFTTLPTVGQVVKQGQVLYRVSDTPVVLLNGSTPAYRSLSEGDSGPDVQELNADLVELRYASRSELDPGSDYFSAETGYALEQLQAKLGIDETGSLTLGQAVFLPAPVRITKISATLGTKAPSGGPVAQATTTLRQVQLNLDASEQSSVKVGDYALVTLPNNQTTPGVVSGVGTVATSSSSGTTIPVYVTLKHPQTAGSLDQAPVQVQITTGAVKHALIVPIDALLALSGGGYAVETVDARGVHRLVAVTLGTFDDANGTVQVTGDLRAGERIVVPNV
jgi:hypothetical protein